MLWHQLSNFPHWATLLFLYYQNDICKRVKINFLKMSHPLLDGLDLEKLSDTFIWPSWVPKSSTGFIYIRVVLGTTSEPIVGYLWWCAFRWVRLSIRVGVWSLPSLGGYYSERLRRDGEGLRPLWFLWLSGHVLLNVH